MNCIHILCPGVALEHPDPVPRWSDVGQAEDLPATLLTGHLTRFHRRGDSWTAWYEHLGFEMTIEAANQQIRITEKHGGKIFAHYVFPSHTKVLETIRYRLTIHPDGEHSIQRAWRKKGVHFITSDQIDLNSLFGFYPDGYLFTVSFILRFDELLDLADLFEEWDRRRPFTVFGDLWDETYSIDYTESRRFSKTASETRLRNHLNGCIPRVFPSWRGPSGSRNLTARQTGIMTCLTVAQREVESLAEELLAAGFIENGPSSDRLAVASYFPGSSKLRNVELKSDDGSSRLVFERITSDYAANGEQNLTNFKNDMSELTEAWREWKSSITEPPQRLVKI